MSINGKNFSHEPISKLMAIVRGDLGKLNDEGLIDEGRLIKTIMACNETLGLHIREIKQCIIPVEDYKAVLPINFEKLYYTCALNPTNTSVTVALQNPFDNSFDRDVIYDAQIDRATIAGSAHYNVTIKKISNVEVKEYSSHVELSINPSSVDYCFNGCANLKKKGKYTITIKDDNTVETPFRKGELYIMYVANMQDDQGNLLFPFHPLITPWYEWALKEKILLDAIFNSEGNYVQNLEIAQREKSKAWVNAWNVTTSKEFGYYVDLQRKKELEWYKKYFLPFL